ncbi:MAG: AI-2E family transporter [Streptosporangiaceae bacterium]
MAGARESDPPTTRSEEDPLSDPEVRRREARADEAFPFGRPGNPLLRGSPFTVGLTGALGVLLAWYLVQALYGVRQVLILIVVSMFLAVGLNPAVEALQRKGLARRWAVLLVFACVIAFFVGFGFAVVPPLTEQTTAFAGALPDYLRQLQNNPTINGLDQRYHIIQKAQGILTGGLGAGLFGGIIGVGKVVLSAFFSTFTVLVLTLYFLASLPRITRLAYQLVPRTRRARVSLLGNEILSRIGGYVGGAAVIAAIAGTSTFVFLEIVRVPYALALALLVALFDLIPLIGATIGAIIVTAVGFTVSIPVGVACLAFYVAYQQVENYLIYPRVMKRSVDVAPTATIIAALIGGTLLGFVGALLAIPTAAAISLILREVVLPRQESV